MSLGMSMSLSQKQKLSQRLSAEQKISIGNTLLIRMFNLIRDVRDYDYKPKAGCSNCGHVLTPLEIIQGFNRDPNDFNTTCPKCKTRFFARLVTQTASGTAEIPFYCAIQTLDQLRGKEHLSPMALQVENLGVYHSAITHFGNLTEAFRELGVDYSTQAVQDWQQKIGPYLGKLPDPVIAKVVGVSTKQIAAHRNRMRINPFSRRALADEM